jgi:hypothetical protein
MPVYRESQSAAISDLVTIAKAREPPGRESVVYVGKQAVTAGIAILYADL